MKTEVCFNRTRRSFGLLWFATFTFSLLVAGYAGASKDDGHFDDKATVTGQLDLGKPHYSPAALPKLEDIPEGGIGRNFKLIEHNPLVNPGQTLPRGGNGIELGFVRNCLYVPSRLN